MSIARGFATAPIPPPPAVPATVDMLRVSPPPPLSRRCPRVWSQLKADPKARCASPPFTVGSAQRSVSAQRIDLMSPRGGGGGFATGFGSPAANQEPHPEGFLHNPSFIGRIPSAAPTPTGGHCGGGSPSSAPAAGRGTPRPCLAPGPPIPPPQASRFEHSSVLNIFRSVKYVLYVCFCSHSLSLANTAQYGSALKLYFLFYPRLDKPNTNVESQHL